MAQFGVRVQELLRSAGKDASWLAMQTGIANSTISNWLSNPKVQPKPSSVAKVASAFGVTVDDLAADAGYVIRQSVNDNVRAARRDALLASSPRWEKALDRLSGKSAHDQDIALSMLESYLAAVDP